MAGKTKKKVIKKKPVPKKKLKRSSIKPKDTVHRKTTAGHKIVVKKGSAYDKQAKKHGTVISKLRPGKMGTLSAKKDPRSVQNYRAPRKK